MTPTDRRLGAGMAGQAKLRRERLAAGSRLAMS